MYLKNDKQREISNVEKEIENLREEMSKSEYSDLYSFQNKLDKLDQAVDNKVIANALLEKIATYTLAEGFFKNLSISTDDANNTEVKIVMNLPSLEDVAKQIEAYSQIESATNSQVSKATVSDDGGFDVGVILGLRKSLKTQEEKEEPQT